VTVLWAWEASAAAAGGTGVCGDEARARRATSAWMRAHGADRGIIEQVRIASCGEDLVPCYERTGIALRAKRYSDGRIAFYAASPGGPGSPLTAREHEVACLVASGLRSSEIARQLFVSVRTVDAHLRSAYAKTGTGSRVRLANWLLGNVAPRTLLAP
jgi:DNA-binding CsgD family transcriptional regulator